MGYSTHIGFRAGTGASFSYYSIADEHVLDIRIHPFAFMDTTARFDMALDVAQSFSRLDEISARLKAANSTLITIFHNFSLGTDKGWAGWRTGYDHLLRKVAKPQ
jgi:hypothetical protein